MNSNCIRCALSRFKLQLASHLYIKCKLSACKRNSTNIMATYTLLQQLNARLLGCIKSSAVPCAVGEVSIITWFSIPDFISQLWEKDERQPGWVLHMIQCSRNISTVTLLWNVHCGITVSYGTGKMQHQDDPPSKRTHRATKAFIYATVVP